MWACGEFLFEKSWKCNFLQFLWGSQLRTHGSYFEVGKGWAALDLPKIKFILLAHHGFFYSFLFFSFLHGSPWCNLQCKLLDSKINKNCKFRSVVDFHHHPHLVKKMLLTHTYKSRAKNNLWPTTIRNDFQIPQTN
jgi:hypothetical protein